MKTGKRIVNVGVLASEKVQRTSMLMLSHTLMAMVLGVGLFAGVAQGSVQQTWDFESGDLTGWANAGATVGTDQLFRNANNPVSHSRIGPKQGTWYVDGYQTMNAGGSDAHTGIIETDPFILPGDAQFTMVSGGGTFTWSGTPQAPGAVAGIALEREVSPGTWESLIFQSGGGNSLVARTWDASAWAGETVRLRIYDNTTGGWGWTAVDNIVLTGVPLGPDTDPPVVESLDPADDATGVYPGVDLVATFNENIALTSSGTVSIVNLDASTQVDIVLPDAAQVAVSGSELTINPTSNLGYGANYAVQISADAIMDVSSNAFAGITDNATWNFTTAAYDGTAPAITDTSPADDSTDLPIAGTFVATFDDPVVLGSGNIVFYDVTLGVVDQTIAVTDGSQVSLDGSVLTITPASALEISTEYAIQLDAGIVKNYSDVGKAAISDTTTWSFTTADIPTYTWIHAGVVTDWNDPDNWLAGAVPPQDQANSRIVYVPATSGNISSQNSVNDGNRVTVGSVLWESSFNMHSFGSWTSTSTGWQIDTGTADPARFTFSNGGFMGNYYGTWTLNSDLLLSGTGSGGGLEIKAGGPQVVGTGGFIVESGTLQFNNTHTSEDYPYTGGVTVRNVGVVDVNVSNEALGEGALVVEEGGQVQLAGDNLDNNADLISLVVLSAGANPAANTTFLTGSPTIVDGFTFDVSAVEPKMGNQWQIASASCNYHADFSVVGFTEAAAGVWTGNFNGATYEYDESTGILQVTAVTPSGTIIIVR